MFNHLEMRTINLGAPSNWLGGISADKKDKQASHKGEDG